MLSTSAEGNLPYSNTGDVGVWLKIRGATITPNVGIPGRTVVVTEPHDLDFKNDLLRIRYLFRRIIMLFFVALREYRRY